MGARRNPFQGFVDVMTEMDRMRGLGKYGHLPDDPERHAAAGTYATDRVPPADIYALGDDLVIRVAMTGVRAADVDLSLVDGVLTITGESGGDLPDGAQVYTQELPRGPVRRSMVLPGDVAEDRISASLVDGIAEIVVAGACAAPEPGARRIPVVDRSEGDEPIRRPIRSPD